MSQPNHPILSPEQLKAAVKPVPTERQISWQRTECNAFIHYGPNSFTDRAWGTGEEDPDLFDPSDLNTDQWVKTAAHAEMSIVTITAKHHDGFCLWPSRYTTHSVAHSSWEDGEGDVIRDLAESCSQNGLKLGIYLSPADIREAITDTGRYGNGSEIREQPIPLPTGREFTDGRQFSYEVDDYNAYFMSQLFELLTEYGPVYQVWFDGAHPEVTEEADQPYQMRAWFDLIRRLAPDAVISISGPDVRWVGNESGEARDSEWSAIPLPPDAEDVVSADYDLTDPHFPNNALLENATDFVWYPAEADTSLRPGWFFHSQKEPQYDKDGLVDLYYRTVGRNSVLLLNLSPSPEGVIPTKDVEMVNSLGEHIRSTFDTNYTKGASCNATSIRNGDKSRYGPRHVVSQDSSTYWMAAEGVLPVRCKLDLPSAKRINCIRVEEAIVEEGQRIESLEIEAMVDGAWVNIGQAGTVGYARILRFDDVLAESVRLTIKNSRKAPTIQRVGLYHAHRE